MTEQEMRQRMKDIDVRRAELADEKRQYEKYFSDKKQQAETEKRKTREGKYYISRGISGNRNDYVKAFKILKVLEAHHNRYAECLVLVDGCESSCWEKYGILLTTLGLWNPNRNAMVISPNEPLMIDFYKEISQEEFEKLFNEYKEGIIS